MCKAELCFRSCAFSLLLLLFLICMLFWLCITDSRLEEGTWLNAPRMGLAPALGSSAAPYIAHPLLTDLPHLASQQAAQDTEQGRAGQSQVPATIEPEASHTHPYWHSPALSHGLGQCVGTQLPAEYCSTEAELCPIPSCSLCPWALRFLPSSSHLPGGPISALLSSVTFLCNVCLKELKKKHTRIY